MNWKVNDWCFFEFKLAQIRKVQEGKVTRVSTGCIETSGFDFSDRIFPISMETKLISEAFAQSYSNIHNKGSNFLNYPDISNKLVNMWVEACHNKDDSEYVQRCYKELKHFEESVLDTCKDLRKKEVGGVRVFR